MPPFLKVVFPALHRVFEDPKMSQDIKSRAASIVSAVGEGEKKGRNCETSEKLLKCEKTKRKMW